jgi:hypothetical protein
MLPVGRPLALALQSGPKFGLRTVEFIFAGECFYRSRSIRKEALRGFLMLKFTISPGKQFAD